MRRLISVLNWVWTVFFGFAAFGAFGARQPMAGLILVVVAILPHDRVAKFLRVRTHLSLPTWSRFAAGLLFAIIAGAMIGPATQSARRAQIATSPVAQVAITSSTTATAPTSEKSPSLDDSVRIVAKDEMAKADIDGLNYEGVQVSAYEDADQPVAPAPSNAVTIFVNYHLADLPSYDQDAAKFSTAIFQSIFALHPSVWSVTVIFNGPIKDEYGHVNERQFIDYSMSRPTFGKIDWNGLERERLCAFLRAEHEQDTIQTMDDTSSDNNCGLWPGISAQGVKSAP